MAGWRSLCRLERNVQVWAGSTNVSAPFKYIGEYGFAIFNGLYMVLLNRGFVFIITNQMPSQIW